MARQLVRLGEPVRAFEVLNDVVDRGFYVSHALGNDSWLAPLRSLLAYEPLMQRTRNLEHDAMLAFTQMGGPELVR